MRGRYHTGEREGGKGKTKVSEDDGMKDKD